nr:PREDICTED: signal peptidase complex subunit 1 [Opisthocomus hoazin]
MHTFKTVKYNRISAEVSSHKKDHESDYKGQKLAEQIFQGIILVSAIIGFIYGYITEQFGWTVYIVMAGFALSCLLTLPPWPMYRRNPLKWLPVQESGTEEKKPADRKPKRHAKS